MSLRVPYSPIMLARAAEIVADVKAQGHTVDRNALDEEYCQQTYGLSYDYVRKIGKNHKRPSGRVLDNMGLEVWVRNPATGATERLEFDYVCDWNPRRPRPKLTASQTSTNT